jgi:hypothetical protein
MAFVPKEHKGIFTLDKWLRNLGLWRGKSLESLTEAQRHDILANIDWDAPSVLTGEAYDPESKILTTVTSQTRYDPDTKIFEDKIVFWEHKPQSNQGETPEQGDYSVLMIRGRRDPSQKDKSGSVPEIIPDQITIGGQTIFNGTVHGGSQSPYEDKHRATIDRAMSFSKRVKEALYNHDSILDLGKVLAGGHQHEDVFAEAFGVAATLPSLSGKGGVKAALAAYFADKSQMDIEQKQMFRFRQLRNEKDEPIGLDPVDQLKAMMGHHINSVDAWRSVEDSAEQTDTEMSSGVRFACRIDYEPTPKGKIHRFKAKLVPVDVPSGVKAPQPIDLLSFEFTRKDDESFELSSANFFEGDASIFRHWTKARNLIGLYQDIARDLAEQRYPKIRDYIYKNRLHDDISEFTKPPGEDQGGEMVIIPVHSTGLEKDIEGAGNGIGGGICVMSRVTKNEGDAERERLSEVLVAFDLPWEPGGANSAVDGYQPDLTQWLDSLRKGALVLSHDHFDHATLEHYAKNGWLRGVPVFCNARIWDMVEVRMNKMGVPKEDWPQHIGFDHPDVRKVDEHQYVYTVRDEDGVVRGHVQACENAVKHSALTDSHMMTVCYGDDHYKDTVCIPSDNFGVSDHGRKFFKHGQLALARLPEVSLSKLRQNFKSVHEKYIAYVECTNISTSGSAADQVDNFRNNFRKMMNIFRDDAVLWFSFSTNHMERQTVYEVWGEQDTLRHSTSLGANSKIRDTSLNKHSVDPLLDLRDFEMPAELLPQSFYDTAMDALTAFVDQHFEAAQMRAAKVGVTKTADEILEKDIPYQVLKHIMDEAQTERDQGTGKPELLYRAFFAGNDNAFDEIAAGIGIADGDVPRKMPKCVYNALKESKKDLGEFLSAQGVNPNSSADYWMLRSYIKHGVVRFETKNSINEKSMYEAIMRGQNYAALHGSHTAGYVKKFREQPQHLGVVGTGATGSIEEHMAILSRYARAASPMDDKHDDVNGYYLDEKKVPRVLFITQPPSMGEEAGMTQEALIRQIIERRNDTVILSIRDGFKVYNPKGRRRELEEMFQAQGWNVQQATANQIIVGGALMHVSGHGLWQDTHNFMKMLPTKCMEAMHFPSWRAFSDFREMAHKLGKNTSLEKPENYVACVPEINADTGKTILRQRDFLTQRRWGFTLDRKFGQQWGGVLKSVLYKLVRRDGNKRTDGLDIRTDMDGAYEKAIASGLANDFTRAGDENSVRATKMGPSAAEMRSGSTRSKGRAAFGLSRLKNPVKKPNAPGVS